MLRVLELSKIETVDWTTTTKNTGLRLVQSRIVTAAFVSCCQVTFDLCKSLVDEWILVKEEEIRKAVYLFMENHHKVRKLSNNTLRHFALKSLF